MEPRKPTEEEKKQLLAFQLREAGFNGIEDNHEINEDTDSQYVSEEDIKEYQEATIDSAYIAVFDELRSKLAGV